MRDSCSKHDVMHVRGRAKCPWVQGQVGRLYQTLKFMISSRCYSDNLNFSWSSIHLEITYWYNQMIHSTTRFTPSQLLYGTTYKNTFDRFYTAEELNIILDQYCEWEEEDENIRERHEAFYNLGNEC
ncbi:hypothetical protein DMUE_1190 [Dictyocoela muelleri]|nr:hypothetical protein DMUE_1190 [Dictyocoela muelleri]